MDAIECWPCARSPVRSYANPEKPTPTLSLHCLPLGFEYLSVGSDSLAVTSSRLVSWTARSEVKIARQNDLLSQDKDAGKGERSARQRLECLHSKHGYGTIQPERSPMRPVFDDGYYPLGSDHEWTILQCQPRTPPLDWSHGRRKC